MSSTNRIGNYVGGSWRDLKHCTSLDVHNPATGEILCQVALSEAKEVDEAVQAATVALAAWRTTPVTDRVQYLFRLKDLLEAHLEDLAQTITLECGKTLKESRGEMRRAIDNVELACGMPSLIQGSVNENVSDGIDEMMIRQPVGVCAIIAPFNFPGMIPFWFMPTAIACGNTVIVKPSERVPMTLFKVLDLIEQAGVPRGVVNLVNGARETVNAILDHPGIQAISFVGSTAVAKAVYARATANGKRAQCQGGAKNPIIVMPDADLELAKDVAAESAFGCAGQRCLAGSLILTIAEAKDPFKDAICEAAQQRVVGNGLHDGVEMGPVISQASRTRIESLIALGIEEGAESLVDGRGARIENSERGFFLRPTVLENLNRSGDFAAAEVFGPVLGLLHVASLEEAIATLNTGRYGNMACIFTASGANARRFRTEAQVGNIGINLGVAAPMAFFPFSGWKDSFFGDLHAQGRHGIEFFTQTKVVVERW